MSTGWFRSPDDDPSAKPSAVDGPVSDSHRLAAGPSWIVLVYRVPSEPSRKRVAVWRDLKRLGALYLQQCVCILPRLHGVPALLDQITARIPALGGEFTQFDVPQLVASDEARIVEAFRALRDKEYAEIIEECETRFVKEVEFEHFRQNYSFEEAEEIGQDLDKIRRWFDQVKQRDWFVAGRQLDVSTWLDRCQELLTGFEEEVYRRRSSDASADDGVVPDSGAHHDGGLRPLPAHRGSGPG